MNSAELRIKALALNISAADLAAKFETDLDSTHHWLQDGDVPLSVAVEIEEMWQRRIQRVDEVIELAEELGHAELISYAQDEDCAHLGMTAADHAHLLSQVITALELSDIPYQVTLVDTFD